MTCAVHITARALLEIDEALEWLSKRSVEAAINWYERLMEAIQSLEDNPEQHGLSPEHEWYPGAIRQLLYGKKRGIYRILFEVRGDTVYILRVRHGARALLKPGEL